jgi:addiction module RelE/StbE family toxin
LTRVRWTTDAADDLGHIVDRIREDSPSAAQRVAKAALRKFPSRGRKGLAPGTRELLPPWPYIVVYEIIEDQVQILRVRHASQNWP